MSLKNCKAKGSRNEYKTMRLLEAAGYVCMKAGGSLGAFDVIGIGSQDIVLVQCKSNGWPGLVEMETIGNFVVPPNGRKLVHRWDDYARIPKVRIV